MKTSVFRTELPYSTESVWAVMTDTTQYAWRSDLKCIETDSDTVFREIYPNVYFINQIKRQENNRKKAVYAICFPYGKQTLQR